jgi:plasmid stabilization system protein ParE
MRFTVTRHPAAERELGDIWLAAADREQVKQAANVIDRLLACDPFAQGEEFYGDRIFVEVPLAVTYTVSEPDCTV